MLVQAELSLYPLGERDLAPPIYTFLRRLERPGLDLETGPLSSRVSGEIELVFAALREAFEETCLAGNRALVVKMLYTHPGRESFKVAPSA